jgi:prepilin-type processing-associated H-X9-DG protein
MKPRSSNQRNQALTLVEVLVIFVVVMFLGVCLFQALSAAHMHDKEINCIKNLNGIGAAHLLWLGDNNKLSLLGLTTDNRAGLSTRNDSAYILWQAMSNQLKTPKILVCPADRKSTIATSFANGFGNTNISYFVNSDMTQVQPQRILDGDDNLNVGGVPVQSGVLNLSTNSRFGWTKRHYGRVGMINFADGSVMEATSNTMNSAIADSGVTNKLLIP